MGSPASRKVLERVQYVDEQTIEPVTTRDDLGVEKDEREKIYQSRGIDIGVIFHSRLVLDREIDPPSGAFVEILQDIEGKAEDKCPQRPKKLGRERDTASLFVANFEYPDDRDAGEA